MFRDYFSYIGFRIKDWYVSRKKQGGFQHTFHKAAIIFALGLWIVTAVRVVINEYKTAGKEEIITAFNSDAYTDMEAVISTYGKYGSVNITDTAKKLILQDIARQIGVDNYVMTDATDNGNKVKVLYKDSVNGRVVCRFITVGEVPQAECNQYISIEITLNDSVEAAFDYEEMLDKIVKKLDMNSDVTVNLHGEIPGQLTDGMKNILVDNMIGGIEADIVTQNRDKDLYTVYAYDKDIDGFIKMGKDKVNVNLSVFYDEIDDVTCVYLATPINNADY
ncbi:MAG: YwmB family TATA-box binding protein [Lachnospira sp.]|nr:YwmB family TATA-box binding protein [Lachnospira sp.]